MQISRDLNSGSKSQIVHDIHDISNATCWLFYYAIWLAFSQAVYRIYFYHYIQGTSPFAFPHLRFWLIRKLSIKRCATLYWQKFYLGKTMSAL